MGSWYQWLAWWLHLWLTRIICPPIGVGSEGRCLVIGAWKTRVPGGRSVRMVLAMARPSLLVCLVSWRQR